MSDTQAFATASYQPEIFSWNGRIGRIRYLAYTFFLGFALLCILGLAGGMILPALMGSGTGMALLLALLVYGPLVLLGLTMARRRLHDLGRSGWWSLLILPPFVNLVFVIYLACFRGAAGSNAYGPAPADNPKALAVCTIVLIGVMLLGAVLVVPMYQQHAAKLRQHQIDHPPTEVFAA